MLQASNAILVVVDVQGKLAQLMHDSELLFRNVRRIVEGAKVLELPIIWMEQNPRGLGATVPEIAAAMPDIEPIAKMSFSCCGSPEFLQALIATDRTDVLLAGIETHVCVYQTAQDLLAQGYRVHVMTDAVSSRAPSNKKIGLARISEAGGMLTSVEMSLFEMMRVAEGPKFKELLRIVR